MIFSREWLGQYVELPDDAAELAGRLTAAGMAVEHVEERDGDVLFDVDVTTNRPDAMNHLGLAREVAVLYGRDLRPPGAALAESGDPVEGAVRVDIEDPAGCPRYVARLVRGVRVGESPEWLKRRLASIGLRPINNVVDVSNFVLWELGQPLHAFDFAKLAGSCIVVRRARPGERLTTLDGVERELTPGMLVIADAERAVALAGVMGGAESEVTAETVDVLIESAHFDRRQVRRTARALAMHTDASHRFERGADPGACLVAADRAAALIAEVAGGTVVPGAIDARGAGMAPRRGRLSLSQLNAFAGIETAAADVERWLTGLGFEIDREAQKDRGEEDRGERATREERGRVDGSRGGTVWRVTVPSWRWYDFEPRRQPPHEIYPADLYEEVLRIGGLDRIPATLPAIPGADAPPSPAVTRRARIRRLLSASGFAEAIHYGFTDPAADAALPNLRPGSRPVPLLNPISERHAVMRRSLVPNLLESARFNQRRGLPAVRLFEVGTLFFESATLADEHEAVALVCGGRVGTPWQYELDLGLFDLKGALESLAGEFGVTLEARPAELPRLVPGTAAELIVPETPEVIGWLGQVASDDGYPLYAGELFAEALGTGSTDLKVDLPSRFPGIGADFTLTHALDVPWAEIDAAIREAPPEDLVHHELTVRYRGPGVPEGAVNTTIHFEYNARERSLTQEEVNERQGGLAARLERRFGYKSGYGG
jgi:phenylalanyl-tRNA synthetase beta chain